MTWYRNGSVNVSNGSTSVVGVGTTWGSNNVGIGDDFVGPDNVSYEVAAIPSDTAITLATPYKGGSVNGGTYQIKPTFGRVTELLQRQSDIINTFAAVRDGIGQGLIPAGTLAAPGLRFPADQNTGIYRPGEDQIALVTGGVARLIAEAAGNVTVPGGNALFASAKGISITGLPNEVFTMSDGQFGPRIATDGAFRVTKANTTTELMRLDSIGNLGVGVAPTSLSNAIRTLHVYGSTGSILLLDGGAGVLGQTLVDTGIMVVGTRSNHPIAFSVAAAERVRIDTGGNLLVGVTSSDRHIVKKAVPQGTGVLAIGGSDINFAFFEAVAQTGFSSSSAAFYIGRNTSTGRSINAGGTINASGADYAEYMRKALGCGTILKGDVCGVNARGELVRTWADAISYVVKSTDPNLVGGDTWDRDVGPAPVAPVYEAPAYEGPPEPMKPVQPEPFSFTPVELPAVPDREDGEDDDAYLIRLAANVVERAMVVEGNARAQEAEAASAAAMARYTDDARQYLADREAYDAAMVDWNAAEAAAGAAHDDAVKQFEADHADWTKRHEAARAEVDRIAFSGQVPVNVDDATLAELHAAMDSGQAVYLVAVAKGAGIGVKAVREDDMTIPLYMRRVGKLWGFTERHERDGVLVWDAGLPWIDVQHG